MRIKGHSVTMLDLGTAAKTKTRKIAILRAVRESPRPLSGEELQRASGGKEPGVGARYVQQLRDLGALGRPDPVAITDKGLRYLALNDEIRGTMQANKEGMRKGCRNRPQKLGESLDSPSGREVVAGIARRLDACSYITRYEPLGVEESEALRAYHKKLVPLIVQMVSNQAGVPMRQIVAKEKRCSVTDARHMISYILKQEGMGYNCLAAALDRERSTIEESIKLTKRSADRLEEIASLEAEILRVRALAARDDVDQRHPLLSCAEKLLDDLLYLPRIREIQELLKAVVLGESSSPVAALAGLRTLFVNPPAFESVRAALTLSGFKDHESRLTQRMIALGWLGRSA